MRIRSRYTRIAWTALVIVAFTGLWPHPTRANSTGKIGSSGKQPANGICSACHLGGVQPTVHFEGPDQVALGATATFRFVIQSQSSQQVAAGLDVAASSGKLGSVSGQGERLLSGEVTHTGPKGTDANGVASFDFTWQAPAQSGTAILFGAGNSVNLNGSSFGDASAATTFQVIAGDLATPTPTPTDTPPELPTPTPTDLPTPTDTPTPPANTCVGDCDGSGDVAVTELISGVNIALGNLDLGTCPSFDANQDGEVTVNELLQAVNATLNGCPPPGGQ